MGNHQELGWSGLKMASSSNWRVLHIKKRPFKWLHESSSLISWTCNILLNSFTCTIYMGMSYSYPCQVLVLPVAHVDAFRSSHKRYSSMYLSWSNWTEILTYVYTYYISDCPWRWQVYSGLGRRSSAGQESKAGALATVSCWSWPGACSGENAEKSG